MPSQSPVIVPVRQRTPEWVAAREEGIGASEAAASIGMSDWESQIGLWARKLGLVPPPAENVPMRIGAALEPLIAELYTEATGVKVRRANYLRQHPVHSFMLASLDRRAGRKPIELKYSARGTGYGEPGTDDVPDDALVQVIHQLAVTDQPEADVAVLIGGKRDVQIYTVVRDPVAEAAVIEREAEFWDHVVQRTEPPVDGSEATRKALAAIYPRDNGLEIVADEALARLMRALRVVRAEQDRGQAQRDELEARIKAVLGETAKVTAPGLGSITYRTTKDRETVDHRALATVYARTVDSLVSELRAHLPDVRLEGVDVNTDEGLAELHAALESLYTTTKPGTRPFTPRWDQEEE